VTLKVQVSKFPDGSVAVYVTAVTPTGKTDPGAMLLVNVTPQISDAVGAVHGTTALQVGVVTVIFDGQPKITGFVTSFTTTLNVQVEIVPDASVAVYVTGVVPIENNWPGTLFPVILTAQLSVTFGGVQVTFAPQVVEFALTVIVEGQPVITGLVTSLTTTLNVQVA
jgi:hypothetical protein